MKIMLASKIEGMITGKNLHYSGSITIGRDLMADTNLIPFEQVHVLNKSNGERFITYTLEGKGREIILNGAAARLGEVGDEVIILSYEICWGG